MSTRVKLSKRTARNQDEIDRAVISQTTDDSAWEAPIRVKRVRSLSVSIPGNLAARAAFLAKLHHETGIDKWIERVVRERVELEELAFVEAKKELSP